MGRLNQDSGPKLPQALLDTLGESASSSALRSRGKQSLGRKEQRKALRVQKKQARQTHQQRNPSGRGNGNNHDRSQARNVKDNEPSPPPSKAAKGPSPEAFKAELTRKVQKKQDVKIPPPISRAAQAKLDEEAAEIARLERKLGVKGKKKASNSLDQDGFGELLDGLDDFVDDLSGKRKRSEYDDYLSNKRRHLELSHDDDDAVDAYSTDDDSTLSVDMSEDDHDLDQEQDSHSGSDDTASGEEFAGFSDNGSAEDDYDIDVEDDGLDHEEDLDVVLPRPERRENPYVAPIESRILPAAKYVPPSMRGVSSSEEEGLKRLRRQVQGLLNRLSESNLLSILRDIEGVYAQNARQHVTTVLIDLLMGLLCDRTALLDTFIILHAGFAAALYKVLGAHFGAQLLERIVLDFDRFYTAEKIAITGSKETSNLVALLAELYTFQVAGSNLLFDYLRILLADLNELNTELLLKLIKNCGSQLRHDDPSSLKDIVILLQKSVAKVGESNLPVRTKFMIETINDLKNNRQKTGILASTVAAERTSQMKKILVTLNPRAKATEPLGVSLTDIKDSSKEGKWWLVGASWKNDAQISRGTLPIEHSQDPELSQEEVSHQDDEGMNLLQMAKEQRMNTAIRRAIFMNIMSASDYKDAHMRLIKLKLKKAQELEIPRVLIHCASTEQSYNPYYTLIAKRLCTEHRFEWAMQYGLWSFFRRLGEKSTEQDDSDSEEEDEDDSSVDLRQLVNLGRMYGQLMAEDALTLKSLKVLNFAYMQPKTKTFLEIMLATIFKHLSKQVRSASQEEEAGVNAAITALIMRAKDTPQVISGLQYFITTQVNPGEIAASSSERRILKKAFKTAQLVLTQLATSMS